MSATTQNPAGSDSPPDEFPEETPEENLGEVAGAHRDPASGEGGARSPALDSTGQKLPARHVMHFGGGDTVDGEALPSRYEIRDAEDGRVLVCKEAPGLFLRLERSLSFTEQEARRLGERTILLDGVGTFAPLIDDAAHLYNLDHHEDCLRAFTLASCEQALILVQKGLELDRGDWSIYANEPDLDTVFAIWTLLNYRRIRDFDEESRDRIVPLIRLEGAIDANGLEVAEFCGLPQAALQRERARLDRLMQGELEAKRSGEWTKSDPMRYTLDLLYEIDRMVYRPSDFSDFASVEEEYGHVDIGGGRVAVVCRDGAGIYDVEKRLKKVWGDRLGIIALERESQHYTLRRAASLSGIDLGESYERLNVLDPAVDGRPASKRWGGSQEIGGSPRPTGTGLTPREIGKILKLTYRRAKPMERLQKALTAASWALFIVLGGGLAVAAWRIFEPLGEPTPGGAGELAVGATVLLLGSVFGIWRLSRGWTWIYGLRLPANGKWWLLAPLVVAAAACGGAVLPAPESVPRTWSVGAIVLACLAIELCLRGLVHGQMVLEDRLSTPGSRWFVSRPTLVSGLLHPAFVALFMVLWLPAPALPLEPALQWTVIVVAALVCGLGLGLVRERSLSLWPGVALLVAGALLRRLIEPWLLA